MANNEKLFTFEQIETAISNTSCMGAAAKCLNIDWRTFKKEAERFNLYKPSSNKGGKYELQDILNGVYPHYPTSKILPRLVIEGLKEYKCEACGIVEWQGKRIGLELDHIDGNNSNHALHNLRVLCPNCHSQTDTYKSKKRKYLRLKGELAESGLLQRT